MIRAVAVLLLVAVGATAAPVLISYPVNSTGTQRYWDGAQWRDSNYIYTVTNDPSVNPGVLPAPAAGNGVYNAYIMNEAGWPVLGGGYTNANLPAKWIGPGPPQYDPGSGLLTANPGYYVYQTDIYIPTNVDPNTVLVWGSLSSDNCTVSIAINGTHVSDGGRTLMAPGTCLQQGHTFQVGGAGATWDPTIAYWATAAFHAGMNTIQFKVWNLPVGPPNPTGLVVFLQAQGMATPEASTAILLIAGLGGLAWLRRRKTRTSA